MSKGIFIEGITVEMLRNASLEAVEDLMNNGDMVDLEVNQTDIVLCGECKHMMPDGRCEEFADDAIRPSVSDFCSYGERRGE